MHIPPNGASSIPSNTGAFVELTLSTLRIEMPFTTGTALGSHPSSGWSFEPLLNLIGTLTLSIVTLIIVIFAIYPPLPLSVFILTPAAESQTCKSSIVMLKNPSRHLTTYPNPRACRCGARYSPNYNV
ncbi:hypothetical protein OIU84_029427 [Salix udensis]|uniref:Uncharacterized protein n=1 Tax=Salix udensis TaxID=889485 RepID=A0AAD6K980_9ROSI|nr:hypothetical protein OIU84_029427 [Salix udensis]